MSKKNAKTKKNNDMDFDYKYSPFAGKKINIMSFYDIIYKYDVAFRNNDITGNCWIYNKNDPIGRIFYNFDLNIVIKIDGTTKLIRRYKDGENIEKLAKKYLTLFLDKIIAV